MSASRFAILPLDSRLAMEIRERLRHLRRAANLTQAQLADRLGEDQSWVSRREVGAYKVTPDEALEWAEACGFTGALVFVKSGDMPDRVMDLMSMADPETLSAVVDLLAALPDMDDARRRMLLAMLRSALLDQR